MRRLGGIARVVATEEMFFSQFPDQSHDFVVLETMETPGKHRVEIRGREFGA